MATNPFFNNFASSAEQELLESLIVESIKIYGQDMWYIPRSFGAEDKILNEDDLPEYNSAHLVEMYIKNVEGFEGEGDILSRFGLEIRDQVTLTITRRTFDNDVASEVSRSRPLEGDLIFFPLTNKIFEISFVEHEEVFYQLGKFYVYDMKCELFEYSNETFNTGITDIDTLFASIDSSSNNAIANVQTVDVIADNINIEQEADSIIDFSEVNPFSEETGGRW